MTKNTLRLRLLDAEKRAEYQAGRADALEGELQAERERGGDLARRYSIQTNINEVMFDDVDRRRQRREWLRDKLAEYGALIELGAYITVIRASYRAGKALVP